MSTKRAIRRVTVQACQQLTPNMRRLTLGGAALGDFPPEMVGGYIKLLFSKADPSRSAVANDGESIDLNKYIKRSYTVRRFDAQGPSIELDFVQGSNKGPATRWASDAQPGDDVTIVGPGPVKLVDPDADWFLLIGDMTALPAIGVNVERLKPTARGYAVIEVASEEDKQDLPFPPEMEVSWTIASADTPSRLSEITRRLAWLDGRPSVWAACEFDEMRQLRTYLRKERALGNDDLYLSSYWKRNATDEEHKRAKATDLGMSR